MNQDGIKMSVDDKNENSTSQPKEITVWINKNCNRRINLIKNMDNMDFNIEVFVDHMKCFYIRMRHKRFTEWYMDFLNTDFMNSKLVLSKLKPHGRLNNEHIPLILEYAGILIDENEYSFHEKDNEESNPILMIFCNVYNNITNGTMRQDNVLLIEKDKIYLSKEYVKNELTLDDKKIKAYAKKLADDDLINVTISGNVEFQPKRTLLGGKRYYSFKKEALKYV